MTYVRSRSLLRRGGAAALASLLIATTVRGAPSDPFAASSPGYETAAPKGARYDQGDHGVSEQRGAATYSIPIVVPPGRAGMQPNLALTYSSQAPVYGDVAAGWTLGLPAIEVDPTVGHPTPTGVPYSGAPVYRAGNARLVAFPDTATTYDTIGTYRAEHDASFARYEMYGDPAAPRWRALHPDGSITTFGYRDGTRRWLVTEVRDAVGNAVTYEWSDEPLGASLQGAELREIEYTSNQRAGLGPHARVRFGYAEVERCSSSSEVPVGAAVDWHDGGRLRGVRRLTTVTTEVHDTPGAAPRLVRELTLGYDDAARACFQARAPIRLLTSATVKAYSPTGQVTTMPPMTFEYGAARQFATAVSGSGLLPEQGTHGSGPVGARSTLMDVDGDGLQDLVEVTLGPVVSGARQQCVMRIHRGEFGGGFAVPLARALPTLAWGNGDTPGPNEGCTLNGQVVHIPQQVIANKLVEAQRLLLGYHFVDYNADGWLDLVTHVYDDEGGEGPVMEGLLGYQNGQPLPPPITTPPITYLVDTNRTDLPECEPILGVTGEPPPNPSPDDPCWCDGSPFPSTFGQCGQWPGSDGDGGGGGGGGEGGWDPGGFIPDGPGWAEEPVPIPTSPDTPQPRTAYTWRVYFGLQTMSAPLRFGAYKRLPRPSGDEAFSGSTFPSLTLPHLTDIDGDGQMDLVGPPEWGQVPVSQQSVLQVCRGQGSKVFQCSFWQKPTWTHPQGTAPWQGDDSDLWQHDVAVRLVDMNGDGLPDLVAEHGTAGPVRVAWNRGGQFSAFAEVGFSGAVEAHRTTVPVDGWATKNVDPLHATREYTRRLVDIDADGRLDVLFLEPGSAPLVAINLGDRFAAPVALSASSPWQAARRRYVATGTASDPDSRRWHIESDVLDVNGDGLLDLVEWVPGADDGISLRSGGWSALTDAVGGAPPYRLKAVRNGRGATLRFEYRPSTDPAARTAGQVTGRLPEVQWLVTAVESDPGASQPVMRTEYRYGAPAFGRPSHADDVSPEPMQFMGWGRVEVYPPVAPEAGGVRQIVHRYRYGNAIPGDPLGGDGRGFLVEEAVYVLEGPAARLHEVSTHRYASELLHRDAEGRELRFVHPTGSEHRVCMPNASGVYDEAACRADTTHYTQRFELWEPWSHAGATTPTLFLKRSESFYEGMGGRSRKVAMDYDVRVRGPEGAFFGVWYQVLPTRQTTYRVTEGSGEVFREEPLARSEMAYDAYGLPWVERHWRGDTSAPEVVIERTFDTTTGNELSIKRPRQVVLGNLGKRTTFDYDQHKLYRTLTTNELGHMVRDVTDVGTGMVLRRQGPNAKVVPTVCGPDPKVAFCLPDVVYDEDAWTIDGFGRVLTHSTSMDTSTSYALTLVERYTYVDGVDTYVKAERLRDVGGTVWLAQQTHHDGLGRVLRERDLAVTHDETRYLYDQGGAVVRIDSPDPRPTGDTGGKVSFGFQHDVLGRVTRFTRPDTWLSGTRIQYPSPLERRVYEVYVSGGTELPASTTIGRYDLEGRLIEVEEYAAPLALDAGMVPPAGDLTSYQYDELGQLAAVDDPEGRTELTHDWLGQRTSITRGIRTWRYEYDLDGNLEVEESPHEASADPSAYRTRTLYDVLGRPTIRMPAPRDMTPARMEELGIGVTRFTYDEGTNGKGQLARVWIGIPGTSVTPATDYLNVEYAYQAQGLVAKETRTFSPPGYAPVTQWVERDYDAVGQLRLSKWDDGQSWRITTDGRGLVQQVAYQAPGSSSWQTVAWYSRGAAGLPRYRTTLNMAMVRRDWSYDALGRVTFDVVKASSGTVATRNYVYGASGDLLQVLGSNRVDVTTTHWAGAMYTYDAKHQLETAGPTSTPSSSSGYTATMEYSPSGNILKAEIGGIGRDSRRVGYVYGGDDEGVDRQAVKQLVALDGAGNPIPDQVLGAFEYDLAGNMTSRTWLGQTTELVWDSDDQLRQVRAPSGAIETYAYDHTAGRVWAIAENAGDASGVRLWFAESETFLPASGATKRRYLHLSDGGGTVARTEHTGPASGIDATSTTPVIELQFADALQNLMVSMRASGTTATVTASFVYGAWGEVVPSKVKGEGDHRRQFNGKEADAVSGLRYYGFRYYDPLVMRWTSADPLFLVAPDAGLASPRRNGLYTFSLNNANQYYDPDGRNADDKDEGKKSAEPVLLDQAATHVSYAGYGDFYTVTWSYGGESGEVVVEGGYVQGPEAAVDGRPHTGRVDLVEYDGFTLAVPRIWGPTLTPRVWTAMMAAKASYAQEVDPLISRGMIIATLGMAYGISFGALPRYSVAVQAPGLARAAPRSAAGGGGRATGQLHHAISRPIHRALEQHPVLRGVYQARDPRLVLRAADGAAHRGYQQWHRALDQEVVDWLRANEAATPAQFEAYLRSLYQRPDLVQRFPLGFE